MIKKEKSYDVVVVGGGMSGICAAIAAARHGAKVALIHNRPVLGGNASSEIRMHICGADTHGSRPHARETGILEEILLENRYRNPQYSYPVFDGVLWEKVYFQDGLDLYLNTHCHQVHVNNGHIQYIEAIQLTSETTFLMTANYFVDTTGDGTLAYDAGADYMMGREGSDVFNEPHAPHKTDPYTMGNTLLFTTKDMGHPVPFHKPFWANTYTEEDLAHRSHGATGYNYWWIELGGDKLHTIEDSETIRNELVKAVYGVWDHVKNGGNHDADNYVLDWVGFLPGKRESRRIVGDYVLTENDLASARAFEDAIGYGGWPMDMHVVGGLNTQLEPTECIYLPEVYTIPYGSIYAKDIDNLYIGGRVISASHMAFGSTRVMATCAIIGQAIGTSAALANKHHITPREASTYIKDIQQQLLRDDAYIPHITNEDDSDLARQATVTCSSEQLGYDANFVINGISRTVKENSNAWHSDGMSEDGEWIALDFTQAIHPTSVEIKFDSNLSKQIMLSAFHNGLGDQEKITVPIELVKDYTITCYQGTTSVYKKTIENNYQRLNKISIPPCQPIDRICIHVHGTHGCDNTHIYEIRVY
ncbi:FAD-dependent oxidoreductase [Vallitalea pronyensis]|uniref:FAD-dependent oxidoreductase n=2 Tax=Vallitalea pronyensis TaxID=1348613 RepID=A0A8J8MGH6_9FIRM|nr:FAD-dependent oxidoreductase [Vallitalea pronyensis]QUI21215.1 FAD-dependent oxidoreductase [Vallitalea pronyensis]